MLIAMDADSAAFETLLAGQRGLATRAQLFGLGVTRAELRWALGRRWWLVLPSVVSTTGPVLTAGQRLVAATLHGGDGSVISSLTAAAWHGVTAANSDLRVHLEVPMSRRPASTGFVVVRRTRRPDPRPWQRGVLAIAGRERAVIQAAREIGTLDGARAIVCEAVER